MATLPPLGYQLVPIYPSGTPARNEEKADKAEGKQRKDSQPTPKEASAMLPAFIPPAAQQGVYGGIQNHGVQQYLPVAEKRSLDLEEGKDIQQGLHRWWPKIGAGYATPMTELMADPAKSATLGAVGTGAVAAVLGGMMLHSARAVGAGIGLVGGGVLGGITSFINRRQQNENIADLMRRLPPGATKRDMMSDPVYQSDLNRQAERRSNSSMMGDFATMALMSSAFKTGGGNYRSRR